jgi:uncharacterized membrane protein (DUF2068 family)
MQRRNAGAAEDKAVAEEDRTVNTELQAGTKADTVPLHPHARGLLLVGLYKLSKAIFFTALGAGALNLVHRNLGDLILRVVDDIRIIDPEGHFVNLLMDRADSIGGHQLRQASLAFFCYAVLCLIEGTGLILRKGWAEYFTVVLTVLAMPWEGYEVLEHYTVFKLALLLLNVVVLLYLLWVLKKKKSEMGTI